MHSLMTRPASKEVSLLYVRTMHYAYQISSVFSFARSMSPCLLIFEDIDTMVGSNSYFFNEVDGLENNDGIMMIATTNHLEKLDGGLKSRPSRFDRKYLFDVPSFDERVLYCKYWQGKIKGLKRKIEFPEGLEKKIAGITDGFSFAYMKEAFVATLLAIARREDGDGEEEKEMEDDWGEVITKEPCFLDHTTALGCNGDRVPRRLSDIIEDCGRPSLEYVQHQQDYAALLAEIRNKANDNGRNMPCNWPGTTSTATTTPFAFSTAVHKGKDKDKDDFANNSFWIEMQKQVKFLREDMNSSGKHKGKHGHAPTRDSMTTEIQADALFDELPSDATPVEPKMKLRDAPDCSNKPSVFQRASAHGNSNASAVRVECDDDRIPIRMTSNSTSPWVEAEWEPGTCRVGQIDFEGMYSLSVDNGARVPYPDPL